MDMDQAAVFLAGSILTVLGFIVVFAGVIIINNMLSKYWKPVKIFRYDYLPPLPPSRFATEEEMKTVASEKKK